MFVTEGESDFPRDLGNFLESRTSLNFLISLNLPPNWNGVWGRGCDEAEISKEKCLFTEWGGGIQ